MKLRRLVPVLCCVLLALPAMACAMPEQTVYYAENQGYIPYSALLQDDGSLLVCGHVLPGARPGTAIPARAFVAMLARESGVLWAKQMDIEGTLNTYMALGKLDRGEFLLSTRYVNGLGAAYHLYDAEGALAGGLSEEAKAANDVTTRLFSLNGGYLNGGPNPSLAADPYIPWFSYLSHDFREQWRYSYEALVNRYLHVAVAAEDGFVLCGEYRPATDTARYHAAAAKISGDGALLWQYTDAERTYSGFQNVLPTAEGGAIVAGYSQPPGLGVNKAEGMLLCLDAGGVPVWTRNYAEYGLTSVKDLAPYGGGYVLLGTTGMGFTHKLLRVDAKGNVESAVPLEAREESLLPIARLAWNEQAGVVAYGVMFPEKSQYESATGMLLFKLPIDDTLFAGRTTP